MIKYLGALLVAASFGNVEAATLNAYTHTQGTSDSENIDPAVNTNQALAQSSINNDNYNDTRTHLSEAKARADFGSLGVQATAQFSNGNAPSGQNGASASASAWFSDVITVSQITSGGLVTSITDGFVRMVFDIEGDLFLDGRYDTHSSGERAVIQFRVKDAGSGPGRGQTFVDYSKELTFNGLTESGNLIADVKINNGYISPVISFYAETSCGSHATQTADIGCVAMASFFNSATLFQSEVFDEFGNVINDAKLHSQSGFDYINGYAVSSVPLPAAFPLYGAGLAAIGFMGWRHKRKTAA
ncbi:MAG: VPLPA-CTERM sorting domain-containing protein [Amylibacter sp.]